MSDEFCQKTESSINNGSDRSIFGIVLNLAEHIAKALPIFLGPIYVIGYIVVATRLAQYGIPATRLLDAQYFAAGLLPGLLVWLTILVLVSAFRYERGKGSSSALEWGPYLILILFVVLLIFELLPISVSENWPKLVHSAVNISIGLAKFALGQLAIWYGIVGWRTGLFSELIKFLKSRGEDAFSSAFSGFIWLIGFTAIGLSQIMVVGRVAYNELPQAYGGGKPLQVQLYVDSDKVPSKLLVSVPSADQDSLALTIPLTLTLQTSTEYIVYPLEDGSQQAWLLKSDVVHAVYIGTNLP